MVKDTKDKKGIIDRLGVVRATLGAIGVFLGIAAAIWFPVAAAKGWWPYEPNLPNVEIIDAQFDAPGDDRDNLNGEWVQIKNLEDDEVDMSGWRLCDYGEKHTYYFGEFMLLSGATVKVHSGTDVDSLTDLYWSSGCCIWDNDGDTAYLFTVDGECVSEFSY